jgi:hypothetical protein
MNDSIAHIVEKMKANTENTLEKYAFSFEPLGIRNDEDTLMQNEIYDRTRKIQPINLKVGSNKQLASCKINPVRATNQLHLFGEVTCSPNEKHPSQMTLRPMKDKLHYEIGFFGHRKLCGVDSNTNEFSCRKYCTKEEKGLSNWFGMLGCAHKNADNNDTGSFRVFESKVCPTPDGSGVNGKALTLVPWNGFSGKSASCKHAFKIK